MATGQEEHSLRWQTASHARLFSCESLGSALYSPLRGIYKQMSFVTLQECISLHQSSKHFLVKATLLPVQRAGLSQAGAGLLCFLLLQMLWNEAGCNRDRVTLGLQKQPPALEPALRTVDCHHLGSGPLFDTLSLCSSGQLPPSLG